MPQVGESRPSSRAEFRCLTLKEFPGAPAVVEDADTFAGNATKKAVELAKWLAAGSLTINSQPSIFFGDDSGLEVERAQRRARCAFGAFCRDG